MRRRAAKSLASLYAPGTGQLAMMTSVASFWSHFVSSDVMSSGGRGTRHQRKRWVRSQGSTDRHLSKELSSFSASFCQIASR